MNIIKSAATPRSGNYLFIFIMVIFTFGGIIIDESIIYLSVIHEIGHAIPAILFGSGIGTITWDLVTHSNEGPVLNWIISISGVLMTYIVYSVLIWITAKHRWYICSAIFLGIIISETNGFFVGRDRQIAMVQFEVLTNIYMIASYLWIALGVYNIVYHIRKNNCGKGEVSKKGKPMRKNAELGPYMYTLD